ncbi:MAG: FAD-binding oxidoreductase [Vicinamibacteria bacterium]
MIPDKHIDDLKSRFRGTLISPDHAAYNTVRQVWNGTIDRRPRLIARCTSASDVVEAVRFGREHNLLTAVRGGGHNVAGNAMCDDGLVIDLSMMKAVVVDPQARTARAEGGATWADFDTETQKFGLATTGGLISSTGVAGLTLGGGIGWLMRTHGLASDNLISADVVTASGETLTASESKNADLFWALRGGGGNFGVVTSFEYQLHPVSMVMGGMVIHPVARAAELLRFYRDFARTAPDSVTLLFVFLTGPPAPFLPVELHGKPLVAIAVCGLDISAEGEKAVRALKEFGPPLVDLIGPMPYGVLQGLNDPSAPHGIRSYWKSEYLNELSDGAINALVDGMSRVQSPMSQIHVHQLGGAVARVGPDATAVSHRSAAFVTNVLAMWPESSADAAEIAWTRGVWEAMRPFGAGAYVNFLGEEGEERVRASYGETTHAKLAAIKRRYDPTNFFRLNQNIRPS